jgi:GMP synthase (glutamine-hydrolysing)
LTQLQEISTSITNTVPTVNRVAYLVATRSAKGLWDLQGIRAGMTHTRLALLREADKIVTDFIHTHNLHALIWQFPVVLVPLSLGEGESIALRPVSSLDGMTAEFTKLSPFLVDQLAQQLLALPSVDAVFYDVTNKPPATIEWE